MADLELLGDEELAVFAGAAEELPLLLSLEDGDAVEELESAGAAGLLQPTRAKDK